MAELISYLRADRDGPKVSNYRIVPVVDPAGLTDALADTLGVRVVVEKARRLLIWRGVRIHLDAVAGLARSWNWRPCQPHPAASTRRRRRSPSCERRSASRTTC